MAQIAAYLLMILAMAERRDCPIAEWEVRGRRALVCLLFSTRVFDLRESPDFTRLLNDPKCLRSSSKSSSMEGRAGWFGEVAEMLKAEGVANANGPLRYPIQNSTRSPLPAIK